MVSRLLLSSSSCQSSSSGLIIPAHVANELIIEAGRTEGQYWRDLFRYRELFYFLAWRDVLVRYKQTVIGVLWAVIRPFLTMVVFVLIFGRIAKLPSDGVPLPRDGIRGPVTMAAFCHFTFGRE